jgi:hypothetical protein
MGLGTGCRLHAMRDGIERREKTRGSGAGARDNHQRLAAGAVALLRLPPSLLAGSTSCSRWQCAQLQLDNGVTDGVELMRIGAHLFLHF